MFVENGTTVCSAASGIADFDTGRELTSKTVFSIGSITKTVTAAAVLKLIDAGELSLDDTAGSRLPGLSGPAAGLTVRQLLSHTSGLAGSHSDDHVPMTANQAIEAITGLSLAFEPGSDFLYSNSGYSILALIIEELTGSYRSYVVDEVLTLRSGDVAGGFFNGEPAAPGPRAIGYLDSGPAPQRGDFAGPHWAFDGNGGIAMTAEQLAAWVSALAAGDIISDESLEMLTTPLWDNGNGTGESAGWVTIDESMFGVKWLNSGGSSTDIGHASTVMWVPETDRVIAIFTNLHDDPTLEQMFDAIEPTLVSGEPITPPRPRANPAAEAVAGTYRLGEDAFEVGTANGNLRITASGQETIDALFVPVDDSMAQDLRAHQQLIEPFFAGDTDAGREELGHLKENNGIEVLDIDIVATVPGEDGPVTYLTIHGAGGDWDGAYTLDQGGSIVNVGIRPRSVESAADDDWWPSLEFGTDSNGEWVPTGIDAFRVAPITVIFGEDGTMTITGPDRSITAERQ